MITLLNFLVLQWLGVRLTRVTVPGVLRCRALRDFRGGEFVTADYVEVLGPLRRYAVLRWIWPLTGWWSEYRWIGRRT